MPAACVRAIAIPELLCVPQVDAATLGRASLGTVALELPAGFASWRTTWHIPS
jgi:hypothetical protein